MRRRHVVLLPAVAAIAAALGSSAAGAAAPAAAAPPLGVGPSCVNGYVIPAPGTDTFDEPLELIAGQLGVTPSFVVEEMRYFTGPESPGIIDGVDVVERWYVSLHSTDDPTFIGRFIVEARTDTIRGVSAVAPIDTSGYQSPDWRGFVGEGPPRAIPGLPGEWVGIEYDFVTGEGDSGQPGLPPEVTGCLDGTGAGGSGLPVTR